MYIKLTSYLEELEEMERAKPEDQRRQIPTMKELAAAAGINPVNFSRLVNGKVGSLNFEVGAGVLDELHRRGFPTTPNDILGYIPPES